MYGRTVTIHIINMYMFDPRLLRMEVRHHEHEEIEWETVIYIVTIYVYSFDIPPLFTYRILYITS